MVQNYIETGKSVKKFTSDIDIDFGDRSKILDLLDHTPAGMIKNDQLSKHATGIYFTDIPVDPFSNIAAIDYQAAEQRGYIKLDFLNVHIYNQIRDEQHLIELMNREPAWDKLYEREFCERLIHIGGHYDTLIKMPEAVNTIPRMAMFLSIIRPGKSHLIGKPWAEVAATVWQADPSGGYQFKRSHSCAYAHLVVIHMNLLNTV